MKIRFLILSFIFLLSFEIKGQDNLLKQFESAERLYNNNNFYDAVTEYKRLLFFDLTGTYQYKAECRIGECYKSGAKFEEAIKYFSEAAKYVPNDDELFYSKTQIIRTNILRKTTDRAIQLCDELEKDERFKTKADTILYWKGWAYMFADNWENASGTFAKISPFHELRKLSDQTNKAKVSVTFAKVISYILPGSGAIYSGKFLSGLMSLGWNALAGYWTINSFVNNRVFDGIVIGELVWLRFYRGAIQNAGDYAAEKNLEIANKSLRYLQNEYKGIKP